jgi:hypothetical protein
VKNPFGLGWSMQTVQNGQKTVSGFHKREYGTGKPSTSSRGQYLRSIGMRMVGMNRLRQPLDGLRNPLYTVDGTSEPSRIDMRWFEDTINRRMVQANHQ